VPHPSDADRERPTPYPIAESIPQEALDAELRTLEALAERPLPARLWGYLRLGGPGFMGAALTLGAGSLTAAMLSGARFGYKTMWMIWVSMGLGVFMLAVMVRFTCRGGFRVIQEQNRRHGHFVGSVLTGLVGCLAVAIIFNVGQVSLGTHLMESLAELGGFGLPRWLAATLYAGLTTWILLSYGRGGRTGTRVVETLMKSAIGLMLVAFGVSLWLVGVDWGAALHGMFVPWLPEGGDGVDLFIASSASAVGVMDWVFLHYAGLARGWGRKHESLGRMDIGMGLFLPFVLVNLLVIALFAGTFYTPGLEAPQTAPELARALGPVLRTTGAEALFFLGFLAVPITTTVGMSLAGAMAAHEALGWEPDVRSWRWKLVLLLPQIGLVGAWAANPVWLVIAIAAFLSLSGNVVAWSMYLLFNDPEVMGDDRASSYLWNLGIVVAITLLNAIAIVYVMNRFGWWF